MATDQRLLPGPTQRALHPKPAGGDTPHMVWHSATLAWAGALALPWAAQACARRTLGFAPQIELRPAGAALQRAEAGQKARIHAMGAQVLHGRPAGAGAGVPGELVRVHDKARWRLGPLVMHRHRHSARRA